MRGEHCQRNQRNSEKCRQRYVVQTHGSEYSRQLESSHALNSVSRYPHQSDREEGEEEEQQCEGGQGERDRLLGQEVQCCSSLGSHAWYMCGQETQSIGCQEERQH